MKTRKLRDIEVSAIGMGCMGFSHGYGELPPKEESIRLIRKTYDLGCTLFDTAEGYGPFVNEELVGEAVKPFRDKVVITTKFSPFLFPNQKNWAKSKLDKKAIRLALEDSLKRLQTDYVDIYYEHRVPLDSNVEEVAEIMGELISEGKIKGWGQSQSNAEQIRKAHAVTPLSAIQSEYRYKDGALYFLSEGGQKFNGLEVNKNVCCAIFDQMSKGICRGLQVTGIAEIIEPDNPEYMDFFKFRKISPKYFEKRVPYPIPLVKINIKCFDHFDWAYARSKHHLRQHLDV